MTITITYSDPSNTVISHTNDSLFSKKLSLSQEMGEQKNYSIQDYNNFVFKIIKNFCLISSDKKKEKRKNFRSTKINNKFYFSTNKLQKKNNFNLSFCAALLMSNLSWIWKANFWTNDDSNNMKNCRQTVYTNCAIVFSINNVYRQLKTEKSNRSKNFLLFPKALFWFPYFCFYFFFYHW